MSVNPAAVTPPRPTRRLVSPVAFQQAGHIAEVICDGGHRHENSHSLSINVDGSTPSTISMPKIESCILGIETLEQRDKFTLYKIEVNNGSKTWIIYRRYKDFVLLNKKLRRLYPQFRLNLPAKRFFKDNFAKDFIERRQSGLEEFTRNLFCHRNLVLSDPVQRFYRLINPPQPSESLEASLNYCQSLERALAELRQQHRDLSAELNSVKIELAQTKYYKDENQDLTNHLQKQQIDVEEVTKSLRDQLAIALENERKAKEEVEKLREEMRAERASVQAARVIQRQKREVEIKRQMDTFSHSQEAVNQRLDSLVTSLSHLSKVQVEIGGRKLEVDTNDDISGQAVQLKKALDESGSQLEKIHRNTLEMYVQEVEDLKAECSRGDFLAKARTQEAETLKAEKCDLQKRYEDGMKVQVNYISQLQAKFNDLQRYAVTTEEKYFFSLVIGVKLNMAVCGYRVGRMNHLKPEKLFERVRNHGISIEHWPSWLSRELSTASATAEHEEEE